MKRLALRGLTAKINATYKGDYAKPASDPFIASVPRIETGILAIDAITYGGFPVGRVSILWGEYSSGKTTIALKLIGMAQQTCRECFSRMKVTGVEHIWINDETGEYVPVNKPPKKTDGWRETKFRAVKCVNCGGEDGLRCLFLDVEGTFDGKWAEVNGIDLELLYVVRTEYAEQALDISDAALRTQECDLLVVDSIAALTPSKEIEESLEKWQQGLAARLVNKAMRKWVSSQTASKAETGRRPTVVLINQVRHKIGVMFGSPNTMPGGKAQTFGSTLTLWLYAGKYKFDDDSGKAMHCEITAIAQKLKVGPPREEGVFVLHLRDHDGFETGDTQEYKVVFDMAMKLGMIEKVKKGYVVRCLKAKPEFRTQKEIVEFLKQGEDALCEARGVVLDLMIGRDRNGKKVKLVGAGAKKAGTGGDSGG